MFKSHRVKEIVMQIVKSWPKSAGLKGYDRTLMVMTYNNPDMARTVGERGLFRELRKEIAVSYKGDAVGLLDELVKTCRREILEQEQKAKKLRELERLDREAARLAKEKFELKRREAFERHCHINFA